MKFCSIDITCMSHVVDIEIHLYRYFNTHICKFNTYNKYMYAASWFANGNSAWKRAALEGGVEFHDVKHYSAVLSYSSPTCRKPCQSRYTGVG